MSIRAIAHYFDDRPALRGAKLIAMLSLADYANDDGFCYPSIHRLTLRMRYAHESSTSRMIATLEKDGELIVIPNASPRGNTNGYILLSYAESQGSDYTKYIHDDSIEKRKSAKENGRSGGQKNAENTRSGGINLVTPGGSNLVTPGGSNLVTPGGINLVTPPPERGGYQIDTLIRHIKPSLDPSGGSARTREPMLDDIPVTPPTPTRSEKKNRGRVVTNLDPRKIGNNGLIAEGAGDTPLEVWREFYSYSPTAAQIRKMMKITDLPRWRSHVEECAVMRGFKGCGNVLESFENGFRVSGKVQMANGNHGRMIDAAGGRVDRGRVEELSRPADCPADLWAKWSDIAKGKYISMDSERRQRTIDTLRQMQEYQAREQAAAAGHD